MATGLHADFGTSAVLLYHSLPIRKGRDQVVIKAYIEVPKAYLTAGINGWKQPADGMAFGTAITGTSMTWTGDGSLFVEPTLEEIEIDPRYRVGFALVTATFVGSREWVD